MVEGFEASQIDVSSDAGIQGLAQLDNSASAETTNGLSTATARVTELQGADLSGLEVGGVASVTGQASLTNAAASSNVEGGASTAKSTLIDADGLFANDDAVGTSTGVGVSSDGTLTGLASISNSASAESTASSADAVATASTVDGAQLNTVEIGGVGSIIGQTTFAGSADATNVGVAGETSDGLATLVDADGLEATSAIGIKSDGDLTGLNTVDLASSAASTSGDLASATSTATTLQGAELGSETTIGGVGTIGGQVDFGGSAAATNVTGNAQATGELSTLAQGLSTLTNSGATSDGDDIYGTTISSDATVQGFANLNTSADASTTAGTANADARGASIDGAQLGDLSIGGVGTVTGSANFAAAANAANVTGGGSDAADAKAEVNSVDGLDLLANSNGLSVSSDAGIQGLASIDLASAAESTGATGAETTATATSTAVTLQGAELNSLTDIGGIGTVAGSTDLSSSAAASNVTGSAFATGSLGHTDVNDSGAKGLDLNATLDVASDASVSGTAVSAALLML